MCEGPEKEARKKQSIWCKEQLIECNEYGKLTISI